MAEITSFFPSLVKVQSPLHRGPYIYGLYFYELTLPALGCKTLAEKHCEFNFIYSHTQNPRQKWELTSKDTRGITD